MTDLPNILADLDARQADIPFGNSAFQNRHFVVGTQDGAARQYRAALLRADDRRRALEEAKHCRAIEDVDLEELDFEIEHAKKANGELLSLFDVKRKKIEREKKLNDRKYTDKLIDDAIQELLTLYEVIKSHPAYTRQDFEMLEAAHFTSTLTRQIAGAVGPHEALAAMRRQDVAGVAQIGQEDNPCLP